MDFEYFKKLIHKSSPKRGMRGHERKFTVNLDKNLELQFCNAKYILGQTLRQMCVSKNNMHISDAAYYKLIDYGITPTVDNIFNITHEFFMMGGYIKAFHKEFTDDHVIPLHYIVDELYELEITDKLTPETLYSVLNKIHLCIITKEEDKRLSKAGFRQTREGNFNYIIDKGAYKQCGIKIRHLSD